ncbi:hypothetical protein L1787_00715 [Acuticoccus sp. M5D2P5]|uniref:hypothetical protein n=1 Tax=Acuticoccus kalidii TaxID=2910977 RepID=UPI001F299838|nr:hypothetical protein [Acuticoccus kalidii]MCF3931932.1 hypothetical protein [Acuticoccus kalidii]
MEDGARRLARAAGRHARTIPSGATSPIKPVVLGVTAALMVGFVFDVGPWSAITGRLLGTADAQEALQQRQSSDASVPSEADRAALRYFAREGDVDRLEAELRRLRALYPGWQPPRDLLDPQGEDTELQRMYDLVGEQRYEEARAAIAERRQRDPSWTPPARLTDLIDLAGVREELLTASNARNFREVLSLAESNERILTCDDVDSLWRVAEAFAQTGRPQRGFDVYAYIVNTCTDQAVRGASLQKAAAQLDPTYVTELFELGQTGPDGQNEFTNARLDIIRGAVARGGEIEGVIVPAEWLQLLADHARTGQDLQDAMLVGFYLYRQGNPSEAAQWFRFALDNGLGSDAAEGYIVALRATGNRDDEALAREVAYQWREQTPELMEAYLDALATILTADEFGERSILDVEQSSVDRFVPVVINQRDANGAQALGWYAFNTCQFIIAEEWFITSANWVPTEAAIYGLALTRLRLGDQAGFSEVVAEWGSLYPSVNGLATGEDIAPIDPVTGAPDDPTAQVGVSSVVCDPAERERLRRLLVEQQRASGDLMTTEAGSLTAVPVQVRALASRPDGMERPEIPRRSVVIRPEPQEPSSLLIQAQTPPLPVPTGPVRQAVPNTASPNYGGESLEDRVLRERAAENAARYGTTPTAPSTARPIERRTTVVTGGNRAVDTGGATVQRRVRQGLPTTVDEDVYRIVERPRTTRTRSSGGGGGSSAQSALASRNYGSCVAITDASIRSGRLSAADAAARGYCLLQLERPVEAAQAFQLARVKSRIGSNQAADAAYGSALAAIATNNTNEAAVAATSAPMSRARRTELQIGILTQRAIAANRDGRYVEALYYLDQRSRIAPLQKDLMLLQGYAYQNAGDFRSAQKIFRAVHGAGASSESMRAINVAEERKYPPQTRSTVGDSYR